jgi:hypothetical protein
MSDGNVFLLSWDMHGLESVINVTAIEQETTWNTLQDKPTYSLGSTVNAILFRARANSQRHYEVYTVTMESSITEDDIREMFEAEPQRMADLIRERGRKVYSDRYNDGNKVKIV